MCLSLLCNLLAAVHLTLMDPCPILNLATWRCTHMCMAMIRLKVVCHTPMRIHHASTLTRRLRVTAVLVLGCSKQRKCVSGWSRGAHRSV